MKLATIEQIIKLDQVSNADSLELATVLGWEVIVKKGTFKVDDYCIYIPIDTLVDTSKPWFNFLRKDYNSEFRIKTIRIRGIWSQGLIIPFNNQLKDLLLHNSIEFCCGYDIGKLIGVSKYQKDANQLVTEKTSNLNFPTEFVSKTDEDNLKSKPELIKEFLGKRIYISKKLDGSSMTIIKFNNNLIICSRNCIVHSDSEMYKFAKDSGILNSLISLKNNIAIQGEFCGPKINSNRLELKKPQFYVFNIKDLDTNTYFSLDKLKVTTEELGLELVPILEEFECDISWDLQKFQVYANNIKYGKNIGEGIVVRPINPIWSDLINKNLSCKIINQNYKD